MEAAAMAKRHPIPYLALLLALILLSAGIFNGEAQSAFGKAIRLCLECIGIG
jgi:hypothetical protein